MVRLVRTVVVALREHRGQVGRLVIREVQALMEVQEQVVVAVPVAAPGQAV